MAGPDEAGGADRPAEDAPPPGVLPAPPLGSDPKQYGRLDHAQPQSAEPPYVQPPPGQPPYGQPRYGPPPYDHPQAFGPADPSIVSPPTNGVGTAAGIVGGIALVLSLIPLINLISWPASIAAIILGAIGIPRANRLGGMSRRMAIAGLVCGIVAIGVVILYITAIYTFQASCTVNGAPC